MNSELTYRIIAKVYDLLDILYFYRKSRSPRKAVYDLINDKDLMVLDICTGTASNAIGIAEKNRNAKVVGIDLSKEMLKMAKTKVSKKNLDNVKLYVMDATKTKFKDETFDIILISLVLHETDAKLAEQILLEAGRVLKKDGKVIVVEWEEPKKLIKKLMFFPIRKMEPKGFEKFLKLDLKDYFEQNGLYIEEIKHCDYSKVIKLRK